MTGDEFVALRQRMPAAVAAAAHELIDEQYAVFNDELTPALQQHGIFIINHAERTPAQRAWRPAQPRFSHPVFARLTRRDCRSQTRNAP